jgi:hypothetical protein
VGPKRPHELWNKRRARQGLGGTDKVILYFGPLAIQVLFEAQRGVASAHPVGDDNIEIFAELLGKLCAKYRSVAKVNDRCPT